MNLSTHETSCGSAASLLSASESLLAIVLVLVFATQAMGQAPTSRLRTDVYPLDGVSPAEGVAYVVDRNLPGLWKYKDGVASIFVQGEKLYRKRLNAPRCVAIGPDGVIYVGDTATREIYQVEQNGTTKPLTNGLIGVPMDLAVAADNTLYVADLERRGVWKWNPTKDEQPQFAYPKANARGIAIDQQNRLWVLSQNTEQLVRYESPDKPTVLVAKRVFEFGHNILLDDDGTAWVSDGYAKAVWKVVEGSEPTKAIVSEQFQNPVGLFKWNDKIAIVDSHASTVFQASREGAVEVLFKIEAPTAK